MAIVTLDGTGPTPFLGQIISLDGELPQVDLLLNQLLVIEDAEAATFLDPYLTRDVLPSLAEMTGQSFTVTDTSDLMGVIRVRFDPTLSPQAYRITSSVYTDTVIEGLNWRGCKHGLYKWMELLGCQRLAMGDAFLLRPARSDIRLTELALEKAPRMDSGAWGWQGAPSGGRWPRGTAEADYNYHFNQRDEAMDWWNRPRATYGSTVPNELRLVCGIQADGGFYGLYEPTLTAMPFSSAQYGRTWKRNTFYTAGIDKCACNGNTYIRLVDGTSSSVGSGPSGTGASITDGAVVGAWAYHHAGERYGGPDHASLHFTHEGNGDPSSLIYTGTTGVVGLYKDFVVSLIDSNATRDVPEFHDCEISIGVAVSDGSPECMDDKCVNLLTNYYGLPVEASATDKTLWRAKRIVELAKIARPGNWTVTEFAYDLAVRVPASGYQINSDIFIQLSNWGFESQDGTARSKRIQQWAERLAPDNVKFGIYAFDALPQYGANNNRYPMELMWHRVRYSLDNGASLYQSESPISTGTIGVGFWGLFKMIWDGPRTYDSLMTEWCGLAFGAAASYMRLTLDRWWAQEWPANPSTAYDLALDFKNFSDARDVVSGDAGSLSRVTAFMTYLVSQHYRRAYSDLLATSPSEAAAEALAEAWLQHNWKCWRNGMIDCVWDHDVITPNAFLGATFEARWAIPADSADWAAWRAANGVTLAGYTDVEARAAFDAIRATYTVPTPATPTAPILTSLICPYVTTNGTPVDSAYMYGGNGPEEGVECIFEVRSGTTASIVLGFSAPVQHSAVRRVITNALTDEVVSDLLIDTPRTVSGDGSTQTLNLAGFAPGFYKLRIESQASANGWRVAACPRNVPFTLIVPVNVPMFGDGTFGGWPAGTQPRYFWVPRNVTNFHLYGEGFASFTIRRPDMAVVTPVALGSGSYRIPVAAGMDHGVWRWESTGAPTGTPRLWDIMNWFAPTKEQLIVPANLYNE